MSDNNSLETRRDAEQKLAETPAGFLLFEYIKALDRAWQMDGQIRNDLASPNAADVRQLFTTADQFRAALVHTMLAEITPAVVPPDEPNIVRMLDVSTAHLPVGDRFDLVCGQIPGQTAATEYGGIVNSATWGEMAENGLPPESASEPLTAIMRHAVSRNCQWVMFDPDAAGLPGFPTFEE